MRLQVAQPTPPASTQRRDALIDSHGRTMTDLRMSVTDRCNFRCVYCMEPDVKYLPKQSLLSLEEYVRLANIAHQLGVKKLRITGGEPTLYPDLDLLLEQVGEIGFDDIALTTNGTLLSDERCKRWKESGLNRITISLDTLDAKKKEAITRSFTPLDVVLRSVDMAKNAGLTPVKVNAVVMKGINDNEILSFAAFAQEFDIDMRFIEFMALDSGRAWSMESVVTAREMKQVIEREYELVREDDGPSSTSMNYRFANSTGRVGFIASVSESFCHGCNRLRILADGTVRPCLFSDDEWSVREVLRSGVSDDVVKQFLRDACFAKSAGHSMGQQDFLPPEKTMSTLGG